MPFISLTKNHKSLDVFAVQDSYLPFVLHFQGVANFTAVYKLLWSMIREHLVSNLDDPVSRHDRNLTSLTSIQKKVKRGRFAKNAEEKEDENRVDPAVVEMILDRYWNSPAREDWFNDVHEGAENLEPGQAQLFLSKHILKYKEPCLRLRVIFEICSALKWDK